MPGKYKNYVLKTTKNNFNGKSLSVRGFLAAVHKFDGYKLFKEGNDVKIFRDNHTGKKPKSPPLLTIKGVANLPSTSNALLNKGQKRDIAAYMPDLTRAILQASL